MRWIPGWQAREEVWHQWISSERSWGATNRRLSGQPSGTCRFSWAWITLSSTSHEIATTTQLVRRTGTGAFGEEKKKFFLEPGRYVTIKLNRLKKGFHLGCLGFSLLAVRRYSTFLWSVQTRKGNSAPSNKCLHSSRVILMASSSRSYIVVPYGVGQFSRQTRTRMNFIIRHWPLW